jgi:hypothetical protein
MRAAVGKRTMTIGLAGLVLVAAAVAPGGGLSDLETLQCSAILGGMAQVEQSLPKGKCIRFLICVGEGDPSDRLKRRLRDAGYKAVRWCSSAASAGVPTKCAHSTVRVLEPQQMGVPVTRLVVSLEGAVNLRCTTPVELNAYPTTARRCVAPEARAQ